MIKLDIFEYCHGCPYFEADVTKTTIDDFYGSRDTDTVIQCVKCDQCKKIAEYLSRKVR